MPLSIKGVVKLGDKAIYFQVSAYEEPQMNSDRRRCLAGRGFCRTGFATPSGKKGTRSRAHSRSPSVFTDSIFIIGTTLLLQGVPWKIKVFR